MRRFPAQDGFAGGGGFIEARDARRVRRLEHEFGVFLDFLGDRAHGVDEQIQVRLAGALRGLDHHGARNDERECRGVGVEAVIDEPLGDVGGADAARGLAAVREHTLVHASFIVGKLENVLELASSRSWR